MQETKDRVTNEDMAYVLYRVRQAVQTLRRLPSGERRGGGRAWPDIIQEYWHAYGYTDPTPPRLVPSSKMISEMDETLGWLVWLAGEQGKLTMRIVWAKAEGYSLRKIANTVGGLRKDAVHARLLNGLHAIATEFVKKS